MKNLRFTLLVIILATFFNSANAVTISYEAFYLDNGMQHGSGFLTGSDINNDGWLTFPEISNWSYTSIFATFPDPTFADLLDIGDFNLDTNTWFPNGLSPSWATPDSGYTAFNGLFGIAGMSSDIFTVNITSTNSSSISEPSFLSSLVLMMVLGLSLYSRKTNIECSATRSTEANGF